MSSQLNGIANTIKSMVTMRQVAEQYGITFNRSGFAVCPFHNEKTASFALHNEKGHCFGCGWNGDCIAFVRELFGLSFADAIRQLVSDFSLPIAIDRKPTLREHRDMAANYRRMLAEQRKKREEAAQKQSRYDYLWSAWTRIDKLKEQYAPKSELDEIDPLYLFAIRYMDYLHYLIDSEL